MTLHTLVFCAGAFAELLACILVAVVLTGQLKIPSRNSAATALKTWALSLHTPSGLTLMDVRTDKDMWSWVHQALYESLSNEKTDYNPEFYVSVQLAVASTRRYCHTSQLHSQSLPGADPPRSLWP